ncbi:hypothetical protein B005_1374 [Nocardiopsis alba ATCC BAA-2165]|uniref:Uncharacterized protein n=1 Tax=Nocardiopsis alba (strain ATCC BAA-2165 / BE74) TaxID=1205910 RepID=J7LAY3_NOCAA|nr:hypothetical protein B005_1374 [Nocardiopsis alba ATCC BAA-2165]
MIPSARACSTSLRGSTVVSIMGPTVQAGAVAGPRGAPAVVQSSLIRDRSTATRTAAVRVSTPSLA